MPRYFLEVRYKGTRYQGFQVQHHVQTIQGEIERAFCILFPDTAQVSLTGSSRTDAGVHALQNYFHFDWPVAFDQQRVYNLNAILPPDIAIINIRQVNDDAHCRFDAASRAYAYKVYQFKDPFARDTGYFYPYPLDIAVLNEAAALLLSYKDFSSFSKKNTQVKTFNCTIFQSYWEQDGPQLIYHIQANRFLRGMVRALVATMLRVGRGTMDMNTFRGIIEKTECGAAFFDSPAQGLTLVAVNYLPVPAGFLP